MKVKHTNSLEFHLVFVILWPVLSGNCCLFSDRILQDMFSTTWMISLYIQIPMKNTSNTGCRAWEIKTAGFTTNIDKCDFCMQEIKLLGHVVSDTQVKVDPERIAAILNYPAPRNQKQLRQFLGTCNYHHRFIINYADYFAPLLGLLKKGKNGSGRLKCKLHLRH